MPYVSKRSRQAARIVRFKRVASQSTSTSLDSLSLPTESTPEPQQLLELTVKEEPESREEIDIKKEPFENELLQQQDEMEVPVELLNPHDTYPAQEECDPFGQDFSQKTCQQMEGNQHGNRCQFCLKQFQEISGESNIAQSKVEFVLGLREWSVAGERPTCCEGCRKMFNLFYEFKRSCLVALSRPAELLVWAGAKKTVRTFVDLKPKNMKKVKTTESFIERPADSMPKNGQETEKNYEQENDSTQTHFKTQTSSNETVPDIVKQDVPLPDFECEICKEKFNDRLLLKNHWVLHFPTSSKLSAPEESTDEPIAEAHSDVLASEPHPTNNEDHKKTYCFRCRKWFSTKTIFTHHKPFCIKCQVRKPPSFECSLCPQKFHRQDALTLHINKHNGVRTIPCRREGCVKMFITIKARRSHERICGQDVKLICSICGLLFRSEGGMRIHLSTHGDPKYPCEVCGKVFYRKANQKKHAATHSEERKFQCLVCGKRFKSHEANRVHQRIHTQEKPYPCHICGQRFMYNCLLKTHLEKGHEPDISM